MTKSFRCAIPDARCPLIIPFLFLLCAGCTSVAPSKALKNVFWEEGPKTPGKMAAFWQCYTQTNPDGDMPLRGVGGRVLFYGEKNASDPVKVNGDVTIYLFDANDPMPMHSVPIKHAIFKKETLREFHRKDVNDFDGYEFFVPVDEVGNEEMDLEVLAVFHEAKKPGKTQALIYSKLAAITLPGPKRRDAASENGTIINLADDRDESNGIVQVSYNQQHSTPAESFDSRKRRSETIQLPNRFTQALQYDQRNNTTPDNIMPNNTIQNNETAAVPAASPYARGAVSEPGIPPFQETANLPVPNSVAPQSTSDWMKPPNRLLDISQRNPATTNDRKFRIDSNTGATPEQVFEDVSKSGVVTKAWLQ